MTTEAQKKATLKWRSTHKENVNKANRKYNRKIRWKYNTNYNRRLRAKVLDKLGGKCSNPNCLVLGGCRDIRCLQIDHINGGGADERKKIGASIKFYNYLLKLTNEEIQSKYQILCSNCNWIKRAERREYKKSI